MVTRRPAGSGNSEVVSQLRAPVIFLEIRDYNDYSTIVQNKSEL